MMPLVLAQLNGLTAFKLKLRWKSGDFSWTQNRATTPLIPAFALSVETGVGSELHFCVRGFTLRCPSWISPLVILIVGFAAPSALYIL